MLRRVFTPNEVVSPRVVWLIVDGWLLAWMVFWVLARPIVFPGPLEVLGAFPNLWFNEGLGQDLLASLTVSVEALVLSVVISLPLAYLSRTPAVRPLAEGLSTLRFLSPAVFFVPLLFVAHSGHQIKVLMLTLGESFFLVTSMVAIVAAVPETRFDDCRTLRMNEWRATWYAVVRGTLDQAWTAVRENAAMGWASLMMVEGIVRAEGGVGVLMVTQEKHLNFAECWAIALAILLVGLAQDYALGVGKRLTCPWSA